LFCCAVLFFDAPDHGSDVLSPDQIDALDIDDSADNVRPVVRNGTIHIESA
jgi:hypothetical protein